jgi:hypothetical protein
MFSEFIVNYLRISRYFYSLSYFTYRQTNLHLLRNVTKHHQRARCLRGNGRYLFPEGAEFEYKTWILAILNCGDSQPLQALPGEHSSVQEPFPSKLIPIYPSSVPFVCDVCILCLWHTRTSSETNTNYPNCKQWQLSQYSMTELSVNSRYSTVYYELRPVTAEQPCNRKGLMLSTREPSRII